MVSARTIVYRLLEPGANLHPAEIVVYYGLPFWYGTVAGPWGEALRELAAWNTTCQLLVFLPLVQVPSFLTGHMAYVDIGWPLGLMVLAVKRRVEPMRRTEPFSS